MSDLLPSAKFVMMMLFLRFGPILIIILISWVFYAFGEHNGHLRGVKETDCKDRGGHLVENECVKRVP